MKKIAVAGATGYLGRHAVKAFKERGFWIRALGRSASKLEPIEGLADEVFTGEVTDPESLAGLCDGIDIVFSSIGITRQRDGLSYRDVDYRGNRNLLDIASASGVSKFVYVHVLNADRMRHVAAVEAKQDFVDHLERSTLDTTVICPTGFFSDMENFLAMARSGRIYLFGDGSNRINPIHGADLADVCADALESPDRQIEVGGPEIFSYRDIAELAFRVLDRPAKITRIPRKVLFAAVGAFCWMTPVRIHGPAQFMAAVMTMDVVGELHGRRRLADHFRRCASAGGNATAGSP